MTEEDFEGAQECTLLAVTEILNDYRNITLSSESIQDKIDYWVQVRVALESCNETTYQK